MYTQFSLLSFFAKRLALCLCLLLTACVAKQETYNRSTQAHIVSIALSSGAVGGITPLNATLDQPGANKQSREESWQYALRAYPNGIPANTRQLALEQMQAMEAHQNHLHLESSQTTQSLATSPDYINHPSSIDGTTWFPIGPAPIPNGMTYGNGTAPASGRATAIAVNPFNPLDVYLGTASGGVWNSSDGGQHWTPMSDYLPSLATGSLTLSHCDSTGCLHIYAGTGENNIRRDTYYGAGLFIGYTIYTPIVGLSINGYSLGWHAYGSDLFTYGSINNVVIDPTPMAAQGQRIFVTISSGESASASESTITSPEPIGGYGIFSSTLNVPYFGYPAETGWTKLTVAGTQGAKPTDLEMNPKDSKILYAGFMGKGIFKSTDSGATWCPLNPGIAVPGCIPATGLLNPITTPFDQVEIALYAANPDILYAMFGHCPSTTIDTCTPSIYRSVDGGRTWTKTLAGNAPPAGTVNTDCPNVLSRYTHTLVIHPQDPNTLYLGALKLCKSTDGGKTFDEIGTDTLHPDHHALVFPDPKDLNFMYDASDGGFAFSHDGGNTWTSGNQDLQISGFQSIASSPATERIIGGTQDNGTLMFEGTRNWRRILPGDGGFTIMNPDNALKMYGSLYGLGSQTVPQRSVKGGTKFDDILNGIDTTQPEAFYAPFVQDPSAPHTLYFGTNRLYKSTDEGEHWTPISPVLGGQGVVFPDIETQNVITAIAVDPSDPNRLYVGYYDGQIFTTANACESPTCWTAIGGQSKGLPKSVVTRIAVEKTQYGADATRERGYVYVTFSGFKIGDHIYRSFDYGGHWESASGSGNGTLPDIPANTISIEEGDTPILWLGTDIGVFKATWPGDNWIPFNAGLPHVPVYELAIDQTRGRIYAATHGRGAFVLTQPFINNYEGWMDGSIWDIPLYGTGFAPNLSCTVHLFQQNGHECATGNVDGVGGAIGTDSSGQLVTSAGGFYEDKPVAYACLNGQCVGNTSISSCEQKDNHISSITVSCTSPDNPNIGEQLAIGHVLGCPQQNNPPETILRFITPGTAQGAQQTDLSAQDQSFYLIPSVQVGDGSTHSLCTVSVPLKAGDTAENVLRQAQDAINANPICAAKTVSATVQGIVSSTLQTGEDEPISDPNLGFSASGVNGSQLVTALHVEPGQATGACFNFANLGISVLNSLFIPKIDFKTLANGAASGTITVTEQSPVGTCRISVPTVAGDSASTIVTKLANAFHAPGIPGPNPGCPANQNPGDVTTEGDGLVTIAANELDICVDDAGIGFSFVPEEMPLPPNADLTLTASTTPTPAIKGKPLTYTTEITNEGPGIAPEVMLTFNMPVDATFNSVNTNQGTCKQANGKIVCLLGDMNPTGHSTVQVVVTPNIAGALTNTTSATANAIEKDYTDNVKTLQTNVPTALPEGGEPLQYNIFLPFIDR